MPAPGFVITCEHASAAVPHAFLDLFKGQHEVLSTHRAFDIGALPQAMALAREFAAPLHAGRVSRLLVDLNRSEGNNGLFSEFSRVLDASERESLMDQYWRPFRAAVRLDIEQLLKVRPSVIHLSVHSFTPVLNENTRHADVGLLYDPTRAAERNLCGIWTERLRSRWPQGRIRRNYPYQGQSDGHTRSLRTHYPDNRYIGIEIEMNQDLMLNGRTRRMLLAALVHSLRESLVYFD